jgi:hypothetical protein
MPKLSTNGTDGSGNVDIAGQITVDTSQSFGSTSGIAFGDGDTAIYESADDTLIVGRGGSPRCSLGSSGMLIRDEANSSGPGLANESSSSSNPTVLPRRNEVDDGIGGDSGELSLITGDTEAVNIDASQTVTIRKFLALPAPTELTIATGAITATSSFHTVDTEADDTSDELDTISGGSDGMVLVIKAAQNTRTVVAKDGTGNLALAGDFSMDHATDTLTLLYSAGHTKWLEISRSDNGS